MIVLAPPSYGHTGQVVAAVDPVSEDRPQEAAPTNAQSLTCRELKDKLESVGSLTILSGPKGWGDTFYLLVFLSASSGRDRYFHT